MSGSLSWTAGTGARLSNQRALRSNEYIGTSPDDIDNAAEPGVTCAGRFT